MERIERKFVQAREKGELALVLYVTAATRLPSTRLKSLSRGRKRALICLR